MKDASDVASSPAPQTSSETRRRGYLVAIIVNVVLLYCAENVLKWNLPWFTPAWADVVWAINLSLVGSIVGNAVLVVNDAALIKRLVEMITTGLALVAAYWIYMIFPFDFGAWNFVAHLAAFGVLLALAIAAIVVTMLAAAEVVREGWRHALSPR